MPKRLKITRPTTDVEFETMMETVDQCLRDSGVKVHARPLEGWATIGFSLGISVVLGPSWFHKPDAFELRVRKWFENRYGNKLRIWPGPGRLVWLIRDDPWEVMVPREFGKTTYSATRSQRDMSIASAHGNVVDFIEDLPDGLRAALTDQELVAMLDAFHLGAATLKLLDGIRSVPLITQALSDLDAAVHHILGKPQNFRNSKWGSFQACEKVLKAFITREGGDFKRNHDLNGLAEVAEGLGLAPIPRALLGQVKTIPGIRYAEVTCTLNEAYAAFWASIKICGQIAGS